jgi:hypothetical protein
VLLVELTTGLVELELKVAGTELVVSALGVEDTLVEEPDAVPFVVTISEYFTGSSAGPNQNHELGYVGQ